MAYAHRAKNTYAALPFISTWKTDNLSTGSSTNTQVKLPLVATGTYKFTVNWGDGNNDVITTWNQAQVTHTYAAIGTYTITITGFIKGWQFGPETPTPPTTGDRLKLLTITQFGCLRFTNDAFMFHGCENLTLATVADSVNLKGVTNAHGFFRRCLVLSTIPNINKWDVSKIQSFRRFFGLCNSFNQNVGNWNVGQGTEFSAMFAGLLQSSPGIFNNGGSSSIGNWDMSNALSIPSMFLYQPYFNQNIGAWDVSKVTNMNAILWGATVFPYGLFNNGESDSIKNWNTSNVTDMTSMFVYQYLFNQPIGSWNTSNVTNMGSMLYAANSNVRIGSFNQNLSTWDTSKVLNMSQLFYGQNKFNQNIGSWDVSNVTNMSEMFRAALTPAVGDPYGSFNNGGSSSINNWNTAKVTNMNTMFSSQYGFNQPINSWNISLVTAISNFMLNKTNLDYSAANYDTLLIGWASRPVKPNLSINFGTIKYTAAASAARAILTSAPNNWTIVDGGLLP